MSAARSNRSRSHLVVATLAFAAAATLTLTLPAQSALATGALLALSVLLGSSGVKPASALVWVAAASALQVVSLGAAGPIELPWWRLALQAIPAVLVFALIAGFVRSRERRTQEGGRLHDVARAKLERSNRDLEAARAQAESANEAKSAFLANMSHELRTPLNAIVGYSEMLLEDHADEQSTLSGDLIRIRNAGTHLTALVSDILDISKIEAGKMELDVQSFELAPLLDEVIGSIEPLLKKRNNELRVEQSTDPGRMTADSTKVRQIMLNLLSNAAKFTENGQITLRVNPSSRERNANWIVLAVEDTGIGMNESQMARLFQPFVQADSGTTRGFGGTGLGLAISRHFCRMMGGDINVQSEPSQGSTFSAKLPRHVARGNLTPVSEQRPSVSALERPILIVDDDEDCRLLVARALQRRGYDVRHAADGREALAILATDGASALVLDLRMPVMDGFDLMREMEQHRELSDIPVIVVSAVAETQKSSSELKSRAKIVLQKGECTPGDILQAIESVVAPQSDCKDCTPRKAV